MASIVVAGDSSGSVTLAAPAVAGTTTLTLPTTSGTLVVTGGAQTVQFAAGSAASPSITFTGDTNTGIFSPSADAIAFTEGGTESMRIDSSGNVGIGTSSPNIASGFTNLVVSDTDNGGIIYVDRAGGARGYFYANGTTSVVLGNTSSIPLVFNTADTERMRIDSSGNVLVNGTTASNSAAGRGNIVINGSSSSMLNLNVGNSNQAYLYHDSGSMQIWNVSNSAMLFATNNAERLRITSVGYSLWNTTSPNFSTIGDGNVMRIRGSMVMGIDGFGDAIGFGLVSRLGSGAAGGIGWALYCLDSSGTFIGGIRNNPGATSFITSSDYRLKENIVPMSGALDKVARLKPCTYTWKKTGIAGQGFIAHELAEVCPDAVAGEKDEVNKDGSIKPQGIDTSFLVATLTAAIQEQQQIVNDLKARIETLESK